MGEANISQDDGSSLSTCSVTVDTINITVKSLKPPLTFSISTSPSDSVSQLKSLVSSSTASAPPPSAQHLLVKGKALADHKLLQEYGLTDGATVHLVLKSGWEKEVSTSKTAEETTPRATSPAIPVLTISVPDDARPSTPTERPLTAADISVPPHGPQPQITSEHYHAVLADPDFWVKVYELCQSSFKTPDDADGCWQTFLEGHMSHLSAGEIAKIKDVVGVTGESTLFRLQRGFRSTKEMSRTVSVRYGWQERLNRGLDPRQTPLYTL
jgi:hypothetical protein